MVGGGRGTRHHARTQRINFHQRTPRWGILGYTWHYQSARRGYGREETRTLVHGKKVRPLHSSSTFETLNEFRLPGQHHLRHVRCFGNSRQARLGSHIRERYTLERRQPIEKLTCQATAARYLNVETASKGYVERAVVP